MQLFIAAGARQKLRGRTVRGKSGQTRYRNYNSRLHKDLRLKTRRVAVQVTPVMDR